MTLLIYRATYLLSDIHRVEQNANLLIKGYHVTTVGHDLVIPSSTETIDTQVQSHPYRPDVATAYWQEPAKPPGRVTWTFTSP